MRLMNVFRVKVFWFAAGISLSWARVRSLLFASLTGGNSMMEDMLGVLEDVTKHLLIRWITDLCKWWVTFRQKSSPYSLVQYLLQSVSLSRLWASSRPHHACDAYVSLAMKVARVTSHSGGPLTPYATYWHLFIPVSPHFQCGSPKNTAAFVH